MRTRKETATITKPDTLNCSVCGKKFIPTEETKFKINNGFTCSWICFLNEARRRSAIKEAEKFQKEKEREAERIKAEEAKAEKDKIIDKQEKPKRGRRKKEST